MLAARTTDLNQFYQTLKDHPLVRQMETEQAQQIKKQREEASNRMTAIRQEQAAIIPLMREELAKKQTKLDRARAALQAAERECAQAYQTMRSKDNALNISIQREREILLRIEV